MTQPGPGPGAPLGIPQQPPDRAQLLPRQSGRPLWQHPVPSDGSRRARVLNAVLAGLLALVVVGTLAYFAASLGMSVFLICGALALVPLGICLLSLYWIDRWEPEPRSALAFAFCWGAGMSVVAALVVGRWVEPILLAGTSITDAATVSAVLRAPLVEETCKGLGVLFIFLLRRRTFDGPIDGVVYAGTVAAGFAFTENILYFGNAMAGTPQIGSEVIVTFLVRGLMSPFAHVMFTATTGAIVGFAARRGTTLLVVVAWAVGLVPAMGIHALWNSSSLATGNFFAFYVILQVPLFLLYVLGIVLLRVSEARLTRRRLADYVATGWVTAAEVTMLATARGRHQALAWARPFGGTRTMKSLMRLATRLAFTRQRILAVPAPGS
ncbi:MAG: PrsW family intramembrane metalloprotease [Actinomycetota bacterium]|nr:PrsW family intramembrane metalloprotease [Actinomycetota bacterium]